MDGWIYSSGLVGSHIKLLFVFDIPIVAVDFCVEKLECVEKFLLMRLEVRATRDTCRQIFQP